MVWRGRSRPRFFIMQESPCLPNSFLIVSTIVNILIFPLCQIGVMLYSKPDRSLLRGLKLGAELMNRRHVEEVREIGMTGQRFTLFALHQDFHSQNAGKIRRECLDQ